jgi:hypothetical protein
MENRRASEARIAVFNDLYVCHVYLFCVPNYDDDDRHQASVLIHKCVVPLGIH